MLSLVDVFHALYRLENIARFVETGFKQLFLNCEHVILHELLISGLLVCKSSLVLLWS